MGFCLRLKVLDLLSEKLCSVELVGKHDATMEAYIVLSELHADNLCALTSVEELGYLPEPMLRKYKNCFCDTVDRKEGNRGNICCPTLRIIVCAI